MNGEGYLLLRREGVLFGVASADVLGLSRWRPPATREGDSSPMRWWG
jgi:hypothetical protein